MIYGSVCSGIEAASVAWEPLGWKPAWFAEIEKFPAAVLALKWPDVPNLGDMTKLKEHTEYETTSIDILVGGTPCQSFSVAGMRKGLDDPRGRLVYAYHRILAEKRPRWMVWENVPGVLSSDGGRDFGAFLGGLAKLGYGFAYRILDAQYFGVPQRRRRVFVVGYLGDWRPAAAVLFERESLQRHPAPSRKKGEAVAALTATGVGTCGADDNQGQAGHLISSTGSISHRLNAGGMGRQDYETETIIAFHSRQDPTTSPVSLPLEAKQGQCVCLPILEAGARTGKSTTDKRAGMGVGKIDDPMFTLQATKQHAVAITQYGDDLAGTLTARHDSSPCADRGQNVVAFTQNQAGDVLTTPVCPSMGTNSNATGRNTPKIQHDMQVRRLTPVECERLQGFPDNHTRIPWRGKDPADCPDGPRYKALGNSMAVPVMRWIGERIEHFNKTME